MIDRCEANLKPRHSSCATRDLTAVVFVQEVQAVDKGAIALVDIYRLILQEGSYGRVPLHEVKQPCSWALSGS